MPFPRGLLVAPGFLLLMFLGALLGAAAAGVEFPTFSGPGVVLLLALGMLATLVLQGVALLAAVPRLITSSEDRTVVNWLSTVFAFACVTAVIACAIAAAMFLASSGR